MGVPFKRPAAEKSGIPVYQPGATTYQQLMQLQQPFVPVSCEYPSPSPSASSTTNPQSSTANPISNNNINAIVNNSNNSNTNNSNSNAVVTSSPQHTYNNHLASSEQTDKSEQNTSSTPTPELSATATSVISPPLLTIPTNHQQQQPTQSSIPNTNPYAVVPYGTATYSTPTVPYSAYSNASIYSHPLTASSSTQSLYADPATIAKEVAQKNYANALKMAAASNAYSGKPLTALSYTGVALNKALIQTPPQTHLPPPTQHQPQYHYQAQAQTQSQHHHHAAAAAAAHSQMLAANQAHVARQMSAAAAATAAVSQSQYAAAAAMTHRPPPMFVQAPHQYLRPQMQSAAAALQQNQAAVAAAQQQLLSQNFFYPGLQGYPLGFSAAAQAAAMQAHHLQPSVQQSIPGMTTIPTGQVPVQTVNPGAAVVLNPYKKMKTS